MITKITLVEAKGNGYTTIPLKFETKQKLALLMPKGWDWDRAIIELTEMWETAREGKAIRTGKPTQDNQTG